MAPKKAKKHITNQQQSNEQVQPIIVNSEFREINELIEEYGKIKCFENETIEPQVKQYLNAKDNFREKFNNLCLLMFKYYQKIINKNKKTLVCQLLNKMFSII